MRTIAAAAVVLIATTGCVERTLRITTEPEGARVWLNDREVGQTPCTVEFNDYGTYDLRVAKEGYAAIWEGRSPDLPVWDAPGPDLLVEIVPADFKSHTEWHFTLVPLSADAAALRDRAGRARQEAARPPFAD